MARIRGSGPAAERLRAFVRELVHKEGAHYRLRAALDLAEHLGKPPSWVSEYVASPPEANADIDTALAICAFYGVRLEDFTRAEPPTPAPPPSVAEREAQQIAAMWPFVEPGVRETTLHLIERLAVRGGYKPSKRRGSHAAAAPADPAVTRRASGQRRAQ